MKTGELANELKVDPKTIRNWIDDHGLETLFSPGARGLDGNIHRILTEADVLALRMIHALRIEGVHDWYKIKEHLESGNWGREFPANAMSAERRTISAEEVEQSLKAMETIRERDIAILQRNAALERVEQLEGEVEHVRDELAAERKRNDHLIAAAKEADTEKQRRIEELLREMGELREKIGAEKDSLNASLMRELGNLQREIGKLEGKLELYQQDQERPVAKENPRDDQ